MKLLRYGPRGEEKPGILGEDGAIYGLSSVIPDLRGEFLTPESLGKVSRVALKDLPPVPGSPRLGPCVAQPGKFICVGINYAEHAAESGVAAPAEPILFMKAPSSLSGPNDDVVIPRGSKKTDWEVELGVVIGAPAKYVSEADALSHVAGYCVVNDVSERAYQLEGTGQWVKGKGADTFGPVGPWLVTPDEIPDPQSLSLWLEVDGRRFQSSSTSHMIFGVAYLISYVSRFMSLQPGDILSTGTPPGVGLGQKPPVYLRPGNRMRLSVDGLGKQSQLVVADPGA